MSASASGELKPRDRVIVALDVPSPDQAIALADELGDVISFYKVGLELLMSGGMERLLGRLAKDKRIFVDLKLPGDIPETVSRAVSVAADLGVSFLTLSNSVSPWTIEAAVKGRGGRPGPQLLYVSFLSSLGPEDFAEQYGRPASEFDDFLRDMTRRARDAGADGFIVSGPQIRTLREQYPREILVSPGIRPAGAALDDHKRSCTPAEAVRLGSDYIVVGRPIRDAPNRREAAEKIVEELSAELGRSG